MTETDIPPGGEGGIAVTFDTGHKNGQQKKTITVKSNDPRRPSTTLEVSAFIEIQFGFDRLTLDMGRLRWGQPARKSATLSIKNTARVGLVQLTTSSSSLTAKGEPSVRDSGQVRVEIAVAADVPLGEFNETVTATLTDGSMPEATLRVFGTVVGNVDVVPTRARFSVDTSVASTGQLTQKVRVSCTLDDGKLRLLGARDPDDRLLFRVDTIKVDRIFEISMTLRPDVVKSARSSSGTAKILTDDAEQPEVAVRYTVILTR